MTGSEVERPADLRPDGGVIRIGFVPLCDCAPVVMAHELGLFAAQGLRVELSREVGWATIRDKIALCELEAAHAPAAMVLGISLGIGSFKVPCATGLVLNLNGNGVTLSNRLWAEGVRDGATLREFVRSKRKDSALTFGVAFSCSSHNFLLQTWLRGAGLDPAKDVNIVVVPPPQMAANLKAGNLDGYCVGEPWNSLAVIQRAGWVVALSTDIAPRHPEKVLLVRAEFAESRAGEHERLVAALLGACHFCQLAENRERVVETLAGSNYLGTNREAIRSSFSGHFRFRKDRVETAPDLQLFAGPGVNEPGMDKAVWARQSLSETGLLPQSAQLDRQKLASMFRADIYHAAIRVAGKPHHGKKPPPPVPTHV
ncbi:Nitrate ABC transporter, ATP-binding protein NtrC [Verrucomicrobia bacterium]|nr:Nitrate ABC transporter, ATP-binding protein NtrC [Verrucomicrobiota bacterium]